MYYNNLQNALQYQGQTDFKQERYQHFEMYEYTIKTQYMNFSSINSVLPWLLGFEVELSK